MKGILLAVLVASASVSASARSVSEADALATFKQIVEKCSAVFRVTDPTVSAMPDGRWRKVSRSDVHTSFDVKKTDSLVSPFAGTVEVTYLTLAATAQSKDEAEAVLLDPQGPAMKVADVYNFAFRDGNWVGLSVDESRELRTRSGGRFESLSTMRKDASRVGPQSLDGQCLGAPSKR